MKHKINPTPIWGLTEQQSLAIRKEDAKVGFDLFYEPQCTAEELNYVRLRAAKIKELRTINGL